MKTFIAIIFAASIAFGGMVHLPDQATVKPNRIGNIDNPNCETLLAHGWRYTTELPPVAEGYERGPITWVEGDGTNAMAQYTDTLIADRLAAEAAADLAANGSRYVLENQYILLCDALRQALGLSPAQAKLGFEELPGMMMMLRAGSKDAYEKLRDAMDMVNAALIRYDVRWWDSAVWHPQPELQAASLKILELAQ